MPANTKPTTTRKAPAVRKKRVSKKKVSRKKKVAAKRTSSAPVKNKQVSAYTLKLDSVAVINNAKALHQVLADIDNNCDVNIDASSVEMIDTAVLQLLFAFVKKVQSGHHKVSWDNPSDEFVSRAELLGLSQHLGIS